MPPAVRPDVETQSVPAPRERPWLLAFLIAPDAVISLGLASGALTFLLRNEGVTPDRAASISALIMVPHSIYFLWGPVTDFWMRRRTWIMVAAVAAAVGGAGRISPALACDSVGRGIAVPWRVLGRNCCGGMRRHHGCAHQRDQ
jgi:hypothetical protein